MTRHDDCYEHAYIARRYGVAVGAGLTREGALCEAARCGISRADVAPVPVDVAARTAMALRSRPWGTELELLCAIHRSAVLACTARPESDTRTDMEVEETPGDDLAGAGWPGLDDPEDVQEARAEALLARLEADIAALEAGEDMDPLPLGYGGTA